jgi:hypothetical protein
MITLLLYNFLNTTKESEASKATHSLMYQNHSIQLNVELQEPSPNTSSSVTPISEIHKAYTLVLLMTESYKVPKRGAFQWQAVHTQFHRRREITVHI